MKAKLKFFKDKTLNNFSLLHELRKESTHWVLRWAWLQKRAGICVGEMKKTAIECFHTWNVSLEKTNILILNTKN